MKSKNNLINQIVKGNSDSFKELYEKYKKKVYKTAYLLLKNDSYIEDVTQEVFIQVYNKLNQLRNIEYFDTWLYRIIYNCCIQQISKNKKTKVLDIDIVELDENRIQDKTVLIEDEYIAGEYRKEVISIIYELPEHYYIPIILYYYNDLSIKQIAEIMQCPEGTIKSRLFNSKNILKTKIIKLIEEEKRR